MSRKYSYYVMMLVIAAIISVASMTKADVVALWEFNGDNFFADSSGNGHTLSSTGEVSQVGNAAFFNGGVLSTDIDLSPYKQVKISWDQNATVTTGDHIVYEHSANYNNNAGAVIGVIGSANLKCIGGDGHYNIDTYTPATGSQSYSVAYDIGTANAANVVRVFQGAMEIGTATKDQDVPPTAFIHAMFNIGDRQGGGVAPYYGTIDNFKIEGFSVPEPTTWISLMTGIIGMFAYAWRKRK